jgi:virginiamycin B lyase
MHRSGRFLVSAALAACTPPVAQERAGLPAPQQGTDALPASAFLAALPDGEAKHQFIIDCTGCHTFHEGIAYMGGQARTRESWQAAIGRMVANYGSSSGFPVIARERDPAQTSQWLAAALPARSAIRWEWPRALEGKADIREYRLPAPNDLPHDVAVAGSTIVITGMFTAQMYLLNPESGEIRTEPTPRPNPRAIEIDGAGNWWVVLGGPRAVARRTPAGEWSVFDAGYYAHSVALAPDGGVWVNGHFTFNPELLSRIDPVSGQRRDFTVPAHPGFTTTPVPYEIRVGRDGMVWMSELQGNRIVRFDPGTEQFKVWTMPTPASGPRRLDIEPSGVVWIPEYGANKLARFDPRSERFEEFALPIKDAAPYIARYDERRNVIWLSTGMADVLFRFDPRTRQFRYYRLPTPDGLVRHFTIDGATGDLWLAPGSSPGTTPSRVVRLRPTD